MEKGPKRHYSNLRDILEFEIMGESDHAPTGPLVDHLDNVLPLVCRKAPIQDVRKYVERYIRNGNNTSFKLFNDVFDRGVEMYKEKRTIRRLV